MANYRTPTRRAHNSAVEAMRRALPLNTYLFLMHQAATMGAVPILNENGKPTEKFHELKPQERLDTIKYLIDKTLPSLKSHEAPVPEEADDLLDTDATSALTTAELVARLRTPATAAEKATADAVFPA